jgi:hypothetical protein
MWWLQEAGVNVKGLVTTGYTFGSNALDMLAPPPSASLPAVAPVASLAQPVPGPPDSSGMSAAFVAGEFNPPTATPDPCCHTFQS